MGRRSHFLQPLLSVSAGKLALCMAQTGKAVATVLEGAFDSKTRTRGLLGRDALADDTALIIAPCYAVHTFGMRFPIDVIFATGDGRVVKLRRGVVPSRMAASLGAFAVVEMCAGSIDRAGLSVGDQLVVRELDESARR